MIKVNENRTFGIELEAYNVSRLTLVSRLQEAGINAVSASYSGRMINLKLLLIQ